MNLLLAVRAAVVLALGSCQFILVNAQDVSSIIDHIQNEQQALTAAPVPNGDPINRSKSATDKIRQLDPSSVSTGGVVFLHPRDKFPDNIAGQHLVGDFFVKGESLQGGAVISAVEDVCNPFSRMFIIQNATSGLPRGTFYSSVQLRRLRLTPSNPLVIVGKLFPGQYAVQTTH